MPAGKTENIKQVRLSQLFPFERHPFKVNNDAEMLKIVESVKQYGVLSPAIARPMPDGGYELVSGHRRKRACELAGLETMPVIVRELDDDAAAILVVDSNLQREGLLPSERAFAYRLKLEAMQHQGQRKDLTSVQVEPKLRARDVIAQEVGESSGVQVQRYIRLTELISPLLDMVDERKIAFNPAYELSFLKQDEQRLLLDAMDSEQATPSLSQAQRLKQFSQRGELTAEVMRAIMSEEKKDAERITLKGDTLRKYFPASYTPKRMEETIIKLLEQWLKRRKREAERIEAGKVSYATVILKLFRNVKDEDIVRRFGQLVQSFSGSLWLSAEHEFNTRQLLQSVGFGAWRDPRYFSALYLFGSNRTLLKRAWNACLPQRFIPEYITHVGIYVGDGWMIHAGSPISYIKFMESYYSDNFVGFGRLPAP